MQDFTFFSHENGRGFSAAALKYLACVFMLIDHIGYFLFPQNVFLRILGRMAFPIFAFFIAEGCGYTRNPIKRVSLIFFCAVIFDAVYFFSQGEPYGSVFATFFFSCVLIFILAGVKRRIFSKDKTYFEKIVFCLIFFISLIAVYFFTLIYHVDYGFAGVITPVLVSLPNFDKTDAPIKLKSLNILPVKLLFLSAGILLTVLSGIMEGIQQYAFLSLILLIFYNGKKGKGYSKYFFYLFYPLHIFILYIISEFVL